MAKQECKSVDEYIAFQTETTKEVLVRVRSAIRKAVPEAEELISYKIPAYKLHGDPVLYFAAWKRHFSLYPVGDRLIADFNEALLPYKASRATLRFPLSVPVPVKLIGRIAKYRAKEVAAHQSAGR